MGKPKLDAHHQLTAFFLDCSTDPLQTSCLFTGYVYATAETLMHVDLDIQIDPEGWPINVIPPTALVYGDCNALPAVAAQLYVGVDQAKLGIGLAAALLSGFPFIGWSVRHQQWHFCTHNALACRITASCKCWQLRVFLASCLADGSKPPFL